MLPRAYTTDAQRKAEKLASAIVAASTSAAISAACSAVESFLHHHSPDNSRWFFSSTFPSFICKLFGFTDSSSSSSISASAGWIDLVSSSGDSILASSIFSLLSPDGVLFSAISSVDSLSLVTYIFPIERLPDWIRFILSNDKGSHYLPEICPLFRGRINNDGVQLNIFEYYIFWFAYYPLSRGGVDFNVLKKNCGKNRLDSWSIPLISGANRSQKQDIASSLYNRLLHSYLLAFVPFSNFDDYKPCRSALLHYPSEFNASDAVHAEFVVNTLVHFWLTYNDFSPLPLNVCKSMGVSVPFRMALGDTPPAPGMAKVVGLFVKHVNAVAVGVVDHKLGGDGFKSKGDVEQSACVKSWNLWIQRPLYRFILRSFVFRHVNDSLINISGVFDLWIACLEPWVGGRDGFVELDAVASGFDRVVDDQSSDFCGYSSSWKGYVVSNYLFYTSLTMHFIDFAHKFLHDDLKLVLKMVLKAVEVLTSSRDMIEHLKNIDRDLQSKQAAVSSFTADPGSVHRSLPRFRERFLDWEDGILNDGEDERWFSSSQRNSDGFLRLFSDGEDGGQQLLQLLVLRAESEVHMYSGKQLAQILQLVHTLKSCRGVLFGAYATRPAGRQEEARGGGEAYGGVFRPRGVIKRGGERRLGGFWRGRRTMTAGWGRVCVWLSEVYGVTASSRPAELMSKWGMASPPPAGFFFVVIVVAAIAMAALGRAFGQSRVEILP